MTEASGTDASLRPTAQRWIGELALAINVVSRLRRRRIRALKTFVSSGLKKWRNINAVSDDHKNKLRAVIIHVFVRRGTLDFIHYNIRWFVLICTSLLILLWVYFGGYVLGYVSITDLQEFPDKFKNNQTYWLSGYFVLAAIYLTIHISRKKLFPKFRNDWGAFLTMIIVSFGLIIVSILTKYSHDIINHQEATILMAAGTTAIIFLPLVISAGYLYRYWNIKLDCQFPLECIASDLIDIIAHLENPILPWGLPSIRDSTIDRLERVHYFMRYALFRKLSVKDTTTWLWREERARLISNDLLNKIRWLITPMADTRPNLQEYLGRMLVFLLVGEWDKLETADDVKVTWAQRYAGITLLAKQIVTSVVPLATFLLARHFALIELDSPIKDYILGGLIVWAALSLVSGIDSGVKEKTAIVKDLLSILPGRKRE